MSRLLVVLLACLWAVGPAGAEAEVSSRIRRSLLSLNPGESVEVTERKLMATGWSRRGILSPGRFSGGELGEYVARYRGHGVLMTLSYVPGPTRVLGFSGILAFEGTGKYRRAWEGGVPVLVPLAR